MEFLPEGIVRLKTKMTTGYWWCYRPFPRDGGVDELHGHPTVGPHLKVWTRDEKQK